jgi:cytochrome P450
MLLYLLLLPVFAFISFRFYNLGRNYFAARKFGIPIILLPVSFEDAWWIPFRPLFSWVERLPFGLGSWYVYTEMGWPTVDGIKTVDRLGENFVLVSPANNVLVSCYPPGIETAFTDSRNWIMPKAQSQLFAFYGQNVSSTEGADWHRHRKIVTSAFYEKSFNYVWTEAIKRTKELGFSRNPTRSLGGIRTTFDVLAMHVLAAAGFGQDAQLTTIPSGHRETLMECLGFILKHIVLTIVFNGLKAPDIFLPKSLRRLKVSVAEFRMYMEESILSQMQKPSSKLQGRSTTLLEAMVDANEREKPEVQKTAGNPSYLTETELYGNLFVFNLAGYETTASSMTFAIPYLAAHPEIQDWIIDEVDTYYKNFPDKNYEDIYPKLVRTRALMYETLRLASPAPLLVRSPIVPAEVPVYTDKGPRTVTVNPGTAVGCHFYGAHLSSRWGADAHVFNPARFVSHSEKGEDLVVPPGPLYIPWALGPRVCPAKKFSQVEFVAVMAQLLAKYRVEMLMEDGESPGEARDKLLGVLDEKYFNVSAYLRRPEDAGVWLRRR